MARILFLGGPPGKPIIGYKIASGYYLDGLRPVRRLAQLHVKVGISWRTRRSVETRPQLTASGE